MNAVSFTKTRIHRGQITSPSQGARAHTHTHTVLDKPENPHPHQPHCTNIVLSSQLSLFFNSNHLLFSAVGTHSHLSGYTLLLLSLWCLCFLSDCIITTCGPPVCSCLHAYATDETELVPSSDFLQKFACF